MGIINTTTRQLFSASAPVTGGRTSTQISAKAAITTKAANDYADTLTLTTAGSF